MLHPATAHFAVVLPIISLVLGLAYLVKPSELMSKVSTRFMVFATIFLLVAFFTGKSDGSDVFILLPEAGQDLLKNHKELGLFLVIAMVIATITKLIGCFKKILRAEIFAILLLAIISGGIMFQGKMGGELTYTYGANVEKYADGMDCLMNPSEFVVEK